MTAAQVQEALERDALLDCFSSAALINGIIQLTHRIHVGEGRGSRSRPMTEAEVADLRAQRDLARAELLRRCQP